MSQFQAISPIDCVGNPIAFLAFGNVTQPGGVEKSRICEYCGLATMRAKSCGLETLPGAKLVGSTARAVHRTESCFAFMASRLSVLPPDSCGPMRTRRGCPRPSTPGASFRGGRYCPLGKARAVSDGADIARVDDDGSSMPSLASSTTIAVMILVMDARASAHRRSWRKVPARGGVKHHRRVGKADRLAFLGEVRRAGLLGKTQLWPARMCNRFCGERQ